MKKKQNLEDVPEHRSTENGCEEGCEACAANNSSLGVISQFQKRERAKKKAVKALLKNQSQHTPTPWKDDMDAIRTVRGNNLVLNLAGQMGQLDVDDAAFIVRAVNSHEALLEAAKEALCWLDPDCKLDGIKKTSDSSDRENMIIDLYAAIAQAEGKS